MLSATEHGGVHMQLRAVRRGSRAMLVAAIVGAGALAPAAFTASPAAAAPACPLSALAKAAKPVQITMWHSMTRENQATLQALTDKFNASQTDVHVALVNQVDYPTTFQKYKAGLS